MGRSEARLYEVQTPRGTVYAVHNLATGTCWTERAEAAARQVAQERGLVLVEEQCVSLDEFLRLTGRQPIEVPPPPPPASPGADETAATSARPDAASQPHAEAPIPAGPSVFNAGPPPSYSITARYFLEGEPPPQDDGIVVVRPPAPPPEGTFCADKPLADAAPPDDAVPRSPEP